MPEPDRLNTSGAYRRAVEGIGDKAMFRDPDMSLEETITKMKTEAMQANSDNLQAKRDAMRAIGGNLKSTMRSVYKEYESIMKISDENLAVWDGIINFALNSRQELNNIAI